MKSQAVLLCFKELSGSNEMQPSCEDLLSQNASDSKMACIEEAQRVKRQQQGY